MAGPPWHGGGCRGGCGSPAPGIGSSAGRIVKAIPRAESRTLGLRDGRSRGGRSCSIRTAISTPTPGFHVIASTRSSSAQAGFSRGAATVFSRFVRSDPHAGVTRAAKTKDANSSRKDATTSESAKWAAVAATGPRSFRRSTSARGDPLRSCPRALPLALARLDLVWMARSAATRVVCRSARRIRALRHTLRKRRIPIPGARPECLAGA